MTGLPVASLVMHFLGLFLIGSNLFQLLGLSTLAAAWLSLFGAGLGLRLLFRRHSGLEPDYQPAMVLVAVLIFLIVLNWQAGELDDDYWIHTPLQGLLLRRGLPPVHPFFPAIELRGHCGRDLIIVGLAGILRVYPITVQLWLSALVHGLGFLLLTRWLQTYTKNRAPVWMAAALFYLGTCVGSRYGFLDAYQNNNSFSFAFNFLALYNWRRFVAGPATEVRPFVLSLAYLGICYEMLWGLVVLTVCLVALTSRQQLKATLVAVLTSVVVIVVCSGSLAHALFAPRSQAPTDMAGASQHQTVELHFPKRDLGCVYITPMHSSPVSLGFQICPPVRQYLSRRPASKDERIAVLSIEYLRQHWLPTWLAPITLLLALRTRTAAALHCWIFASLSLGIPGLVDFGPAYEHENYRWSYTAGAFYALAMGTVLGELWAVFGRFGRLGVLSLFALTVAPAFQFYPLRVAQSWANAALRWPLLFNGMAYYQAHSDLRLSDPLRDAALWLKDHSRAGQVVITDIPHSDNLVPLEECQFLGLVGLQSVGHSFPIASDSLGMPPYRSLAWHRAFWASASARTVEDKGAHWIIQTRKRSADLGLIPGFRLEKAFGAGDGQVRIYRPVATLTAPAAGHGYAIQRRDLDKPVGLSHVGWLDLRSNQKPPVSGEVVCKISFTPVDSVGQQEAYRWSFSNSPLVHIPVATPAQPGRYQVRIAFENDPNGVNTQIFTVTCN